MEEREKAHIQTNQRRLLELIGPTVGFIAEIEQTGILDTFEKAHLVSFELISYIKPDGNMGT